MDNKLLLIASCLGATGLLALILGVLTRLGYYRSIYSFKGGSVYTPRGFIFAFIPLGIGMIVFAILVILPPPKPDEFDPVLYLLGPLLIISYILAMWQPWWLKPKWLRWLEKEHGDIIEILWEEVRKDKWGWERRTRTQEGLEAWVNEMRQKHGKLKPFP